MVLAPAHIPMVSWYYCSMQDMVPLHPFKRVFDLVVGSLITLLLLPLVVCIMAALLIEQACVPGARGPLLYSEDRVSQGAVFRFFKFRIFTVSALAAYQGAHGRIDTKVLEHTPGSLTVVGNILRLCYLDEIPQLWCVLRGDMSLVGPRPTNVVTYETYCARGGVAKKILKAGLTGYFQSHKGLTKHLVQEEVDMEYARLCRTGPWWKVIVTDTYILLLSIFTVLRAEGI